MRMSVVISGLQVYPSKEAIKSLITCENLSFFVGHMGRSDIIARNGLW
jgi:hypothetical protein